jgi:hypothetical protein
VRHVQEKFRDAEEHPSKRHEVAKVITLNAKETNLTFHPEIGGNQETEAQFSIFILMVLEEIIFCFGSCHNGRMPRSTVTLYSPDFKT